jgi:hypothetical protein
MRKSEFGLLAAELAEVVDYNTIDNDALREHIDRVGREIFRRFA